MQQPCHRYSTLFNQNQRTSRSNHCDQSLNKKNALYFKKRQVENQKPKMQQIRQSSKKQQFKSQKKQAAKQTMPADDRELKKLIMNVITSADKTAKAFLPYGNSEIQQYCCEYFLNKEKLCYYLDENNSKFFEENRESSNNCLDIKKEKQKRFSSKLVEIFPVNNLNRLQNIIQNKIIPILQNQFKIQKRIKKKPLKWKNPNGDYKQAIELLQRLSKRQRIYIHQSALILEKIIIREMQNQEKNTIEIDEIERKVIEENEKLKIIQKKCKVDGRNQIINKKNMCKKIQNKCITERDENNNCIASSSQKSFLQILLFKHKLFNSNFQQFYNNNEQNGIQLSKQANSCREHVNKLNDVIKTINIQNNNLEHRIKNTNKLLKNLESQFQQMISNIQNLNITIKELQNKQTYKTKLIEQYLRIIDQLQQCIKTQQSNITDLHQQNQGYLGIIKDHANQKQEYNKHIILIQEKQKELEEIIVRKQMQIQQLINHLNTKIKESNDHQRIIEHLHQQLDNRDLSIQNQNKENKDLRQQIKLLQANQQKYKEIQSHQNALNQFQDNNSVQINTSLNNHYLNQQNNRQSPIQTRQISLRQTSVPFKYKQIKSKLRQVIKENAQLKFKIERIKTFTSIQKESNRQHQILINKEREQLKYLKNILNNYLSKPSSPTHRRNIQTSIHKHLQKVSKGTQQLIDPLYSPKRDDFIPSQINKQQIQSFDKKFNFIQVNPNEFTVPATIIIEQNDMPLTQNKKRYEREDFIPADINKQIKIQEIQLNRNEYQQNQKDYQNNQPANHHSLNEEIPELNITNMEQFNQIHNEITQKLKQQDQLKITDQVETGQVQSQPGKIQQLLDLNQHIGEHILKLKQKMTCKEELLEIQTQIQYMTSLLKIYKKNTLKKLEKIKKTEMTKKQAEDQVQRLKKRLDEALIANQISNSSSSSNSQDSDFAFPQHLHSFFNHANPFVNKTQVQPNPDPHPHPYDPPLQIFTQTQLPPHKKLASVESDILNFNESILMSEVRNLRLTNRHSKQFLNGSQENQSPTITNKPQKTESIFNFAEFGANISQYSLRDTMNMKEKILRNPEASSKLFEQNLMKLFGNNSGTTERKESIISLDKLLEQQNEKMKQTRKFQLQVKNIQTDQHLSQHNYKSYLNNPHSQAKNEKYSFQAHSCNGEIQQMKQILRQRQQEMNKIITQKDQQIQKLNFIIKNLANSQQISIKQLPKESVELEKANKDNEKDNIFQLLLKQREQIQRLNTLIKNHQFHQRIQQLKSSYQYRDLQNEQNNKNESEIKYMPFGNNQVLIYQMMPIRTMNNALKIQRQTQSQIKEEKPKDQLKIDQYQSISPHCNEQKVIDKQIHIKSESCKQKKNSPSKKGYDFGWSDLVPEYFGKKQQDRR